MTLLALGEVYIYIYIHAIVSDSQPSLSLDSIWTLENQNNTYIITVFQLNLLCPTGYIFVIKLLQLSSLDLAMPYPTIRELSLTGLHLYVHGKYLTCSFHHLVSSHARAYVFDRDWYTHITRVPHIHGLDRPKFPCEIWSNFVSNRSCINRERPHY